MDEDLKPCPFCGNEAEINVSPSASDIRQVFCPACGASNIWGEDAIKRWNKRKKEKIKSCPICGAKVLDHEAYDGTWLVQCPKCYLTSPYKSTCEEAIEAWNHRTADNL